MAGFSNVDLKDIGQYSFLPGGTLRIGYAGIVITIAGTPPATVVPVYSQPTITATGSDTADFGTDVQSYPELSDTFALITGRRVLAEICYRRLTSDRGLNEFHADSGFDLRRFLNEGVTDATIFASRAAVEAELKRDARILDVIDTVRWSSQTSTMTHQIQITAGTGPFELTIAVTSLTIELLNQE